MVAPAAYPCARCGSSLRWIAAIGAWACDACKVSYPPQGATPTPVVPVPRRSRRALAPKQKILVIAGAVSGVALLGIVLVLALGGGKGAGKATPEDLFRAAIDRATADDGDGLFALSGMETMLDRVIDCSGSADKDHGGKDWRTELIDSQREEITRHLDGWKGLAITVTSVEPTGDPEEHRAGTSDGGCDVKTDLTEQHFRVKVMVKGKDGTDDEAELRFRGARVDGLWYLDHMPSAPPSGGIARLRKIKEAMCACKDSTCAQAVQKDLEQLGKDMSEAGAPDDGQAQSAIINELTDCEVKAMSGGPSPY